MVNCPPQETSIITTTKKLIMNPYELHPQGYIDCRPNYDDRNSIYSTGGLIDPGQAQPSSIPPQSVYASRVGASLIDDSGNLIDHPNAQISGMNDAVRWTNSTASGADMQDVMAVNPYELHSQGYLDTRPTYDDRAIYSGGSIRGVATSMTPQQGTSVPPQSIYLGDDALNGQASSVSGDGFRWRDPDLHEVIEFLSHPNPVIRANAAAHLQHLCFSDDNTKQKARTLGAIPALVNLLTQDSLEIQRNACGALRNISYGRRNDENKKAIKNAGGLVVLVNLLKKTNNNELAELITGVLWNLSSCESLKRPIIDEALSVLINRIIIPQSGWTNPSINQAYLNSQNPNDPLAHANHASGGTEMWWSVVFCNASGVLRNISSDGENARKTLREYEGLVDALLYLIRSAVAKRELDKKSVENCVCILRNLSYRCQEVVDSEYDKHIPNNDATHSTSSSSLASSRAVAMMGSVSSKVGDNLGCFGGKKKSKETEQSNETQSLTQATQQLNLNSTTGIQSGVGNNVSSVNLNRRPNEPVTGMTLLWQPDVVQPYLAILSLCSNPETLEAAAGAIQNLAACYWQPSIDIRAAVRKEKGLPVLVELLRMEVDRVVCAVATALRNLALDPRNKELIGKYAMRDLVSKLPEGKPQHDAGTSDDTIAAVLATLNEVISKNADFAKSLLEVDGMERLVYITRNKSKFSPRVFKFTSQLLFNMWQHLDLREVYRKAGYKESHFLVRNVMNSRNSSGGNVPLSPNSSANNTLSRPMSTQSGTRYEDRTLPRGGGRDMIATQLAYNRSEEMQLAEMAHRAASEVSHSLPPNVHSHYATLQQQQQQQLSGPRPPVGGVQIYPPGVYVRGNGTEPVYAQVNRERKKQSHPGGTDSTSSTQALLGSDIGATYDIANNEPIYPPASIPADDSWV